MLDKRAIQPDGKVRDMAAFIRAENLKHRFLLRDEEGEAAGEVSALNGIDMEVEAGQFIAILGQNGSGKSTFARHLNALLTPTEGTLVVDGKNVEDEDVMWEIRRAAGMIFQNPDNQIVAGVVEEDVAFGPENLGMPAEEIRERVGESLDAVDMADLRRQSPENLSGGQKQRVAVAGVLAMQPKCILMDEPTAMLDPAGRKEVLETAHRLNREQGVTILLITHFMEEAAEADYIYVLDGGRVVLDGTPREVFSREACLREHGLELPQITRLAGALIRDGWPLPEGILTRVELAAALCALVETAPGGTGAQEAGMKEPAAGTDEEAASASSGDPGIAARETAGEAPEKLRLDHVSYTYKAGTSYASHALRDVSLTIREGEIIGLIGSTGSGKSTLIQMFDGLLTPDEGQVYYEGQDIHAKQRVTPACAQAPFSPDAPELPERLSLRELRGRVGLVFQFAENQLFETTVLKDVAYGPKNLGVDEEEALARAKAVLNMVDLDENCWERSPFELSGGQRRRAAIAGVIAMGPSVLILDEPTAGLDPRGKEELFKLIRALHEELSLTVILVSHSMEDVADLVDRIVVLRGGEIMLDGAPAEVFSHVRELEEASLAVPEVTYLMENLSAMGFPVSTSATTPEEAKREIERLC